MSGWFFIRETEILKLQLCSLLAVRTLNSKMFPHPLELQVKIPLGDEKGCERFCSYLPATPQTEDMRWAGPLLIREIPSQTWFILKIAVF
jgi:hypothetical protein